MKKIIYAILFITASIASADELINRGICEGHTVSECKKIFAEVHADESPEYCGRGLNESYKSLPQGRERTICESRYFRLEQLQNSPLARRQKASQDVKLAALRKEFVEVQKAITNITVSARCKVTESLYADQAIQQLVVLMQDRMQAEMISSAIGIYPSDLALDAVEKGKQRATDSFCRSLSEEWKGRLINVVYELARHHR